MRKRLIGLAAGLTLFALLGIVVLNGPAAAAPGDGGTNFFTYLNGGNEVPPTTSTSSGMASFHVNYDGTLSYTVTAFNVPNVVMGHVHLGAPGTNGPVVLNLLPMGKPGNGPSNINVSGTATAADLTGPLKGQPLSALISQLGFNAYVNIHTSDGTKTLGPGNYPDGEIRGYTTSSDANRLGTQPALPVGVSLPTGVVPFTPAGPPQISVPQIPVAAPANNPSGGSTSMSAPASQTGGQSGNAQTGAGGSTMGAASGAPTTGGSGASNTSPGNTPGFSGTGSSTGNSSGSTNLGAGGGISAPTGAGTVGKPATP